MQHCEFCGSDLPVNAHFCLNCGRLIPDGYKTATDITYATKPDISTPQTPPLFSSPSYQTLQNTEMHWEDANATFQTWWSASDMESVNPQFTDRKTDDNEKVLQDLLLPGMLAMPGQLPSSAQAPMVQGSPQVGGVPSVQGTPAAPGNAPLSIQGQGFNHVAGSSAPSSAPEVPQSPPIHHLNHQPVQHVRYESPPHHYQPVHHPQSTPPPHELEHHHRHHTGQLRGHRPHSSRLHHSAAVTSKAGMSVVSKWLIVTIIAIVIIGSSSIILTHALMPTPTPPVLTISGTNIVRDGGVLHLHGQGFQPGDGVTLTIDNGLLVSLTGQHGTQTVSQGTKGNAQVPGLSQMNIAEVLQLHSAAGINITVSSKGTFDANVTVPSGLPAGKHIIHATDNQSSRSASLQFTVPSSQLAVNPTTLNFGSVEAGRTVKLSVTVSNQGGARLHWTASVDGSNTNWLTLPNSTGVIETNGSEETIIVTANTNGLSIGPHSATLRIHSDNGDAQIAVKINVISIAQSGQQAILNVPQQNLDFGHLQTGQQAQQSISIANLGNLPLQWQASSDAASATWLSLATTKGTVQSGAAPQTVQVKVNTTGLAAGSYSGTINITSNGGNATVPATLAVTPVAIPTITSISPASGPGNGGTTVVITGTGFTGAKNVSFGQTAASNVTVKSDTQLSASSPAGSGTVDVTVTTPGGISVASSADQFTYITAPPTWSVSPTSLDSSTCGLSTSCALTLTEGATSTLNIDWTVTSDVGAAFDLSKGTLKPGGQQPVSVSGMACKNGTITFTGSGGAKPLTVSWNCTPPTPKITVTPQNIGTTDCSPNSDGTYNCTVTVGETTPGNLKWVAPTGIGGTNVSFKPLGGQLSTSQPQQPVTISSIPCSSASFTFTDQNNNTATVTWSCTPTPTPGTGGTWMGTFTYYNPKNGSQFNATLTLPALPPEGQSGSSFNNGTLSEPVYSTVVLVNGTVGSNLSEFNSGEQVELQDAINVWDSGAVKYMLFSDPAYVSGNQVVLNCSYAAIQGSNGQWEGVWFYPGDSSPDGTFNLNQA